MGRSWGSVAEFEAFLDDGGIVEPGDAMPDDYREQVFRFIELHANSELMGGLTERDWIPKAPGLRRKMAVLAKTQDEIGHAHLLYMVAADLGAKTRTEMLEDLFAGRGRFHNVFHYQAVTWADQVAIAYLVDAGALISQQAVFKQCSYGPYRRILRRIIAEEGFHMRHGEEMLLTFADGTAMQRAMFQEALDRWWWPTLHMFGPPSRPGDALLRWRIKSERNEDLRDRFVQKYATLLDGYGFVPPDPELHRDPDTGRWVTGEIDWAPLRATLDNLGPDSARRIGDAAHHWADTAWVRAALDAVAARDAGMTPRPVRDDRPVPADPDEQEDDVWAALRAVDDPEYPGVSVVDLGLVEAVRVDGGAVEVDLVPTFSGCPALAMIAADVGAAVGALGGVDDVSVRFVAEPAWTPARITAAGRATMATSFAVAVAAPGRAPTCPRCGGATLVETSMFGPVRCRSIHRCRVCGEHVEVVR